MLSLENLSLELQNTTLFSKLSLTLMPGSITHLKGANGAGKTTLLRALAGILTPITGRISWNGFAIQNIKKPYANYIGHNFAIKPELTVVENIHRAAELYSSVERVQAAIYYFGLSDNENSKCFSLSAGNQKKAALCRLLACSAKLWLLDEAEANLDEDSKQLLANAVYSQAGSGGIIIFTSHQESSYIKGQSVDLGDFNR